jgi:hypothetical protein
VDDDVAVVAVEVEFVAVDDYYDAAAVVEAVHDDWMLMLVLVLKRMLAHRMLLNHVEIDLYDLLLAEYCVVAHYLIQLGLELVMLKLKTFIKQS